MWLTLIACGADQPLRSAPTDPTVKLENQVEAPKIVWSDLSELFAEAPASLPLALAGTTPGMSGREAIERLDAAHHPAVPVSAEHIGDHFVASTLMKGREDVGIALIFDADAQALLEVQLALPDEEALPVLGVRWGNPTSFGTSASGAPEYTWKAEGAPWEAHLGTVVEQPYPGLPPKSTAILRYVPVGS